MARYELSLLPNKKGKEEKVILDTDCTYGRLKEYEKEGWLTKKFFNNMVAGNYNPDDFDAETYLMIPYVCYRNAFDDGDTSYMSLEEFENRTKFNLAMVTELYIAFVFGANDTDFESGFREITGKDKKKIPEQLQPNITINNTTDFYAYYIYYRGLKYHNPEHLLIREFFQLAQKQSAIDGYYDWLEEKLTPDS